MAVINEDFIRCEICNNAEFEKKEIVTLPKGLKRDDKTLSYPVLESEVRYYCTACGTEKK